MIRGSLPFQPLAETRCCSPDGYLMEIIFDGLERLIQSFITDTGIFGRRNGLYLLLSPREEAGSARKNNN